MSALIFVLCAVSATVETGVATATEPPTAMMRQAEVDDNGANVADDEPSFFERVYPLTIPDDPTDTVDENMFPFFAGGLLFWIAGNVWVPALCVGSPTPSGFWSDALLAWVIHLVAILAVEVGLGIVSGFVPAIAPLTGSIMALVVLGHAFYLTPIAVMNAYDRALKRQRGEPRVRRRSRPPPREPVPAPAAPPPPPEPLAPDERLPGEEDFDDEASAPPSSFDPAGPSMSF